MVPSPGRGSQSDGRAHGTIHLGASLCEIGGETIFFAAATLTEVPMSSDKSKREQDRELSEALEETFPASDAVAVNEADDRPVRPVHRKPALIDKHLVEELAEEVARKSREPPVSSEE